jgi:hypothetical protein
MATNSNECREYKPIKNDLKWYMVGKIDLQDCCIKDPKDEPKTPDCCYNSWSDELKLKRDAFGEKTEIADQARDRLASIKGRRDGFRKWYEDLQKLHEYSGDICDQFDLIISQVSKICGSSRYTVKAVEVLYCMIRDYYSQLDSIKTRYDRLMECVKALDSSILVPKTGFMKCLENYYEKLIMAIDTKDKLIKQIMEIIRTANMVHEDVCAPYGLSSILEEWQCRLHCKTEEGGTKECNDDSDDTDLIKYPSCFDQDNNCAIYPSLIFPICKDRYWKWVKDKLDKLEKDDLPEASRFYLEVSKEKESIAACITSLEAATAIADPSKRCN